MLNRIVATLMISCIFCACGVLRKKTAHGNAAGGEVTASLRELLYALRHEYNERKAIDILKQNPSLAGQEWDGVDDVLIKGSTPLHYAAHYDYMDLVKLLMEYGADVNASGADWWRTPLAWAADAASVRAVEFLIANGAEVNADIGGGKTVLHAVAWGGSTKGQENPEAYRKTAELLIEHGAEIDIASESGSTPLATAVESGNKVVEGVLRQHGARE